LRKEGLAGAGLAGCGQGLAVLGLLCFAAGAAVAFFAVVSVRLGAFFETFLGAGTRGFAASWREKGAAVETLELPGEDHFSLLGLLAAPEFPLGRAALMQVLES